LKLKSNVLLDALNFLMPGFEKTGTIIETGKVQLSSHLFVQEEGPSKHYLLLSTRSRYVAGRVGIEIEESEFIPDFNTLVDYDKLRNYIGMLPANTDIDLSYNSSKGALAINDSKGIYRFSVDNLEFDVEMPEMDSVGSLPFDQFNTLMDHARAFTTTERNTQTGNSIRLTYDGDNNDMLWATVYHRSLIAAFSIKPGTKMEKLDVYVRASIFKKIGRQDGLMYILSSKDSSVLGLAPENVLGRMAVTTLNDIEDSSEIIRSVLQIERPYLVTFNRSTLSNVVEKMSLFSQESVLIDVHDGKAHVSSKSSAGSDGNEVLAVEHIGAFHIELPIKVINNVLRIDSDSETVTFDISEDASTAMVTGKSSDINYVIVTSSASDTE